MATIDEVAAMAGVSVATVSRVMNNSYVVSEDKRVRVLQAAQALNYQPSTFSRSQRRAENKTILIICSVVIYDVVAGVQAMAKKLGYDVLIHYNAGRNAELDSIKVLNNKLVDGIILLNVLMDDDDIIEINKRYPVVHCGEYMDIPNAFQVSTDNEGGAHAIVNHLISQGRKRIAFVAPDIFNGLPHFVQVREKGYRLALQEHGLPFSPDLIIKADFSLESGYDAGRRILAMADRPDAVFCATDTLAVGCIHTFRDHGLSIPADIAVAGFDNDEASEICTPPLTTVAQPFFEIGCETVRLLTAMISEEMTIGRSVMIDYQLKIRESTAGKKAKV
jgi:LacI family transcriptional regulator, repressor for deo operon, udp, cdd, tsx, nupC, and nupG